MNSATEIKTQDIARAKRIWSAMATEEFYSYSSERANDFINHSDRAKRCIEAAENGADGSTHQERIQDMRCYWEMAAKWNRTPNTKGGFREYPYRLDAAMCAYFDSLEEWHEKNGSLWSEIG